ncbi:MAG: M20/M25/M40 family metallo-hydrolase [Chloroflexi bacterium]|nr:M20/M25/M40 family metallo-hydrolase [Chloroflexota bacterium]
MNEQRLLQTFLELVRISSPSGQEAPVAAYIGARLAKLGIASELDPAGNVIARIDGSGQALIFTAHMDTVVPCDAVNPVVVEDIIASDGTSILGGDDKSGVAAILEAVECLVEDKLSHRPLELVFTVKEEVGLLGAKALDTSRLRARMAVGLDAGGEQGTVVVQAPSQDSLQAVVHGKAAHAGASPEKGINAIRVAAEAIAAMPLGRIDQETTANIGIIHGGSATNIVPDTVAIRGEARSRDNGKLEAQSARMRAAFEQAAAASGASVDLNIQREYSAYCLDESAPIVQLVSRAMRSLGIEPKLMPTGGGSDANILNAEGIAAVQVSTGMQNVHTVQEKIALADIAAAARVLLACATL